MKHYFKYIESLPVNENFTDTVPEKSYWRFDTKEFKLEHKNAIKHQGQTVGYLSTYSRETALELIRDFGSRRLLKECGSSRPNSIFGLIVLPNMEFPKHLDYHANRTSMVYNVMLSGSDSETTLHDEQGLIFKFHGIHDYHFNPNRIIHGAITRSEPIYLLQFFYSC